MSTAYEQSQTHTFKQSRLLYVVLQGEFALFRERVQGADSDLLWIMAPEVETHVYKAGPWTTNWATEGDLPKYHRLQLRHVHGEVNGNRRHCDRCTPENNSDIFLKLGHERLTPRAPIVITAPMPLTILPGRLEPTPSVVIAVKDGSGNVTFPPVPPNPTVIPILVYKWYEDIEPDLWDLDAHRKVAVSGGPDQLRSMQIYASSKTKEDKYHAQDAFAKAAELLGVNASVDWIDSVNPHAEFATPPPGLAWAQVNLFLYQILKLTPDELISDGPVKEPASPLDVVDSGNCGPITG